MDEVLNSKELPSMDPPDQTENDAEARTHSATPERQTTGNENVISPILQETILDGRNLNSSDENSENDERAPIRSDVNGDIGESEILIHHHPILQTAMELTNESAFNCKYPGCNFTSVDAELYLKHEDSHVDGGSVNCDICNVRFPTYANMRRHHLYIHQGIRTFECQLCSKRFLRKEQFMEHILRHSKPRPYQCTVCGVTFNFRGQLKSHLSGYHADLLIDKSCNLCDFKAPSINAIKVHYATFHLKPNMEATDNRPHDLIRRVHVNQTENGAIDLATVSQNFSFMAAHYPSFAASTSDSNAVAPGPSDLSRTSKVIRLPSPIHNSRNLISQAIEQTIPPQEDGNRHTCVTSLAGSTTVVSPPTCQERSCARPHAIVPRERVCVKPEPPELVVDDSQNSNVQPTSTMDLSTSDIVETTCVTTNEAGSSETPCRRKVHKHSSTDDTGSESHCSPPTRHCMASQIPPQSTVRTPHTCCRFRPYERHTCVSHKHGSERRARYSDSDIDRSAPNDHSDGEERKVFYSRATSTNMLTPGEVNLPRANHASTLHGDGSSESQPESNFYNRKNTIVIRDIESCTLTCVYCGIIFPDQTLYLLHRSLHSEASPWKCNLCGKTCKDKYDFNSHVISKGHY